MAVSNANRKMKRTFNRISQMGSSAKSSARLMVPPLASLESNSRCSSCVDVHGSAVTDSEGAANRYVAGVSGQPDHTVGQVGVFDRDRDRALVGGHRDRRRLVDAEDFGRVPGKPGDRAPGGTGEVRLFVLQ